MQVSKKFKLLAILVAVMSVMGCTKVTPVAEGKRELMIVANDEKQTYSDEGKAILSGTGRDTMSIIDIGTNPLAPKILATIPMPNTIAGPPVNLAITPNQNLALVANSLTMKLDEDGKLKTTPDNRLFVVDLTTSPPKIVDTLTVGSQPSGLSINKAGNLALVANRADNSVSVLRITAWNKVELIDTVPMGESVAHVRFTPDGKRALVAKFPGHKIALLEIDGEKVTRSVEVPVGKWPYNVDVTPDGKIALSADNGNSGASDGIVDTVSVIDIEGKFPKVIEQIVVGDAPEGLVISPTGKMAVAVLLKGSSSDKKAPYYNRNASVVALKIDGKKVTRSNEVEVRGLPEGAVFSADGQYLYVGNFIDQDITILKVEGDKLVNTGKSLNLPGHPAAMRGKLTH